MFSTNNISSMSKSKDVCVDTQNIWTRSVHTPSEQSSTQRAHTHTHAWIHVCIKLPKREKTGANWSITHTMRCFDISTHCLEDFHMLHKTHFFKVYVVQSLSIYVEFSANILSRYNVLRKPNAFNGLKHGYVRVRMVSTFSMEQKSCAVWNFQ